MFKRVPLVQSYGPSSAVPLTAKFRPIDTRKNEAKWATQTKNSFLVCTVTNRRGVVLRLDLGGLVGQRGGCVVSCYRGVEMRFQVIVQLSFDFSSSTLTRA